MYLEIWCWSRVWVIKNPEMLFALLLALLSEPLFRVQGNALKVTSSAVVAGMMHFRTRLQVRYIDIDVKSDETLVESLFQSSVELATYFADPQPSSKAWRKRGIFCAMSV